MLPLLIQCRMLSADGECGIANRLKCQRHNVTCQCRMPVLNAKLERRMPTLLHWTVIQYCNNVTLIVTIANAPVNAKFVKLKIVMPMSNAAADC